MDWANTWMGVMFALAICAMADGDGDGVEVGIEIFFRVEDVE